MSDHIQPGGHPDADQLSAFTEHALPPHEREALLLHLALCAECREVIALSLPPMEAAPAVPERRRWFSGMTLLWPAAALATLTFLLVYAHHVTPSGPGARNEVAQNQTSPAPAIPRLVSPAASSLAAGTKSAATTHPKAQVGGAPKASSTAEPSGATIPSTDATLGEVMDSEMYSNLPLTTGGASQAAPRVLPSAASAAASGSGGAAIVISGAAASPTQLDSDASASDNGALRGSISSVNGSSTPIAGSLRPATPAPAITNGLSDDFSSARADTLGQPIISPRLPSGAAVLSMAERGRQMVAIDTKNAVFLSNDGGVHWVAVAVPWKSRAVKAELVLSATLPTASIHGAAMGSLASSTTTASAATQAAQSVQLAQSAQAQAPSNFAKTTPAPPGSVSGTVTDPTGAVVAGATITLKGAGGQNVRTTNSNRSGHYQLDGLPNGSYDLEAFARGFQILTLHATAVDASQAKVVNLTLQVGSATETVTVTSAPPMIEPEPNTAPVRAAATLRSLPLFTITTDTGERWTSADGVTWQRR